MVVGNGDIARVLPDRDDLLFFASGVSNSQCDDENEYEREIELLSLQDTSKHIVYFSTLSLFYGDSRYIDHKWQMETLVKEWFEHFCIFRIGNIDWGTNPHTLINYLRANPKAEIRNEWRYVVDKDEFLHWVNLIPLWNCEMNVPGRRLTVREIYDEFVA